VLNGWFEEGLCSLLLLGRFMGYGRYAKFKCIASGCVFGLLFGWLIVCVLKGEWLATKPCVMHGARSKQLYG
jgi:uncharacterized membrane protein (UPF0136 family)